MRVREVPMRVRGSGGSLGVQGGPGGGCWEEGGVRTHSRTFTHAIRPLRAVWPASPGPRAQRREQGDVGLLARAERPLPAES
eukprot:gene15458-biopygen8166